MAPAAGTEPRRARVRRNRAESRGRIVAAAAELVRERSYSELSVGEIMAAAGSGRTIFYRHFDDIPDLLRRASREAIEALYDAEVDLAAVRKSGGEDAIRAALEPAVEIYRRHGPLLRALAEAAAADEQVAAGRAAIRERFDVLVARSLSELPELGTTPPADLLEVARALNLMNESYLLDAFGREPRVDVDAAVATLGEIWLAVIERRRV